MGIYKLYFKKYRLPFITAIICVFCEALCDLMQPTIMADIIDNGIKTKSISLIVHFGLIMLGITLLGAFFAATRNILSGVVSQSFAADFRADIFKKILRLSQTSVDRIESGSLITRVTNDSAVITQFVNGMMRVFFKSPIVCVGSIFLAVMMSPKLSIVLLSAVFAVSVLIFISMRLSYSRFSVVQQAIDRINTVIQEYLLDIRLVKAFGRYTEEEKKFDIANTDVAKKNISAQMIIILFSPLMSLAISLCVAGTLYFGSILFRSGLIDVGKIAAYINYMSQILTSLVMITNIFNVFVRTKASNTRILQIMEAREESGGDGRLPACGPFCFKNVTFSYPFGSGRPSLDNLSFNLDPGKILAIIGPTGSGKSTIAQLCMRFYQPDSGSIFYNGIDIQTVDIQSLRKCIAFVPQKSVLFSGSVYSNIAQGNQAALKEDIFQAAELAQADGFIRRMQNGYDSLLEQAGANLSGGQKQRLSIARALVRNADILIMDDCTSALDAVTEARVLESLKTERLGKSVILITQKINTAMSADIILVLDDGHAVALGSHDELLVSCTMYQEIYESQIGKLNTHER